MRTWNCARRSAGGKASNDKPVRRSKRTSSGVLRGERLGQAGADEIGQGHSIAALLLGTTGYGGGLDGVHVEFYQRHVEVGCLAVLQWKKAFCRSIFKRMS